MLKHQQVHTVGGRRLHKGETGRRQCQRGRQPGPIAPSKPLYMIFFFFIKGGTFEGVSTEKQHDMIYV